MQCAKITYLSPAMLALLSYSVSIWVNMSEIGIVAEQIIAVTKKIVLTKTRSCNLVGLPCIEKK